MSRDERLQADLAALGSLKKISTIFDFEPSGDPPDRYTVIFRGKGAGNQDNGALDLIDVHKCDVRLPLSYPRRPPDVRWLTPIYHPNVSFSGFLSLREIGLPWDENLGLDIVCERLWDIARLAYMDPDKAANYGAASFFAKETALRLPLDHRPLRDRSVPDSSNIIKYERKGRKRTSDIEPELIITNPGPEEGEEQEVIDAEVLYIGEENRANRIARAKSGPALEKSPPVRKASKASNDDDVFFIGYD